MGRQPEQNLYELYNNNGQSTQGAGQPPPPFQSPGSPPPPFQSVPSQPQGYPSNPLPQQPQAFQSNTTGQPMNTGYQPQPQPQSGYQQTPQGQPHQQQGFQQNGPGQPQAAYQPNVPVQQQQHQHQQQQPGVGASRPPMQYLTAIPLQSLSVGPAPVDCPACGNRGMSTIDYVVGQHTQYVLCPVISFAPLLHVTNANLFSLWAFCLCFWCCLGCIPYLISDLQDVKHSCGNCGTLLAIWRRGGGGVQVMVHARA